MRVYKFMIDPSIPLLESIPTEEYTISQKVSHIGLIYNYIGDITYLVGGSIVDPDDPNNLKDLLIDFISEVCGKNGITTIPNVDIVSEKVVNVSGNTAFVDYSFEGTFKEPVYLQIGETTGDCAKLNKKAADLIQTYMGDRFIVGDFKFECNGIMLTGVSGKFKYVYDVGPSEFREFCRGIMFYVFSNLDETYGYQFEDFSRFNYTVDAVYNSDEVPHRYLVTDTSDVTVYLLISRKDNGSLSTSDLEKFSKQVLSELKKKVFKDEWNINLKSEKINFSSDAKTAEITLVYNFQKLRDDANPILILDKGDETSVGAVTTIVLLALILAISLTWAYIVHEYRVSVSNSRSTVESLQFGVIIIGLAFLMYVIYKMIKG